MAKQLNLFYPFFYFSAFKVKFNTFKSVKTAVLNTIFSQLAAMKNGILQKAVQSETYLFLILNFLLLVTNY